VSKLIIALLFVVLVGATAVAVWIFVTFGQPFGRHFGGLSGDQSLVTVQDSKALRICTDASALPWASYDPATQKYTGGEVEIGGLIAKEMNLTPEYVNKDFNAILPALTARNCDIIVSAMTNSANDSDEIAYSNPYLESGQALLLRKDEAGKINGIADLKGKIVGVIAGSDGAALAATIPDIKAVKAYGYDADSNFYADLQSGLIDAVIYDQLNNVWYARNHASQVTCLCSTSQLLTHSSYVVIVRDDDHALLGAVNSSIKNFTQTGQGDYQAYRRILTAWYGNQ
jgi:ABC-type amino acid transport substrate-binding protein